MGDEHVGAFPSEGQRHRAPDARIAARDHGPPPLQASAPPIRLLAEVWRVPHFRFEPGMLELFGGQVLRVLVCRVPDGVLVLAHGVCAYPAPPPPTPSC